MSIKVKKSTMVYPALETPRINLWLSRIDMIIRQPYSHTHLFYIYHYQTNDDGSSTKFFDTNIMKESLSRVLVPFYPVAGRLKLNVENGRYEIECNAKGALFIEAEATTHALADFGDYSSPDSELRSMVFPTVDYSGGLSSFPLLIVQLTRFKCGGVCLGYLVHHHVADGASHFHFINSWARLAKGLDLSVYPVHDRATYLGPRCPRQIKFQHKEYEHPSLFRKDIFTGKMMSLTAKEYVFKLTKSQINALKLQATNAEMLYYEVSTFAVLAGHVWRSICKARGLAGDQEVRLYIPINGRSRLKDPTLPQGYFGNVLFYSVCVEKAGDVICKPLWHVASKIQDAIKNVEDVEYLRSAIDYLESHPDPNLLVRGPDFVTCINLVVNSWARFPFKRADFGWVEPEIASISRIKYEGISYLVPSLNGDGSFSVAISLFPPHKALFSNHFYDFKNSFIASI